MYGLITYAPVVSYFHSMSTFIYYKSGVFGCPSTIDKDLNHGVEVVGYDAGGNYLIKNSWGTKWGINGFAYINKTNDCGLSMYVYQFVNGESNRTNTKICSTTSSFFLTTIPLILFFTYLLI